MVYLNPKFETSHNFLFLKKKILELCLAYLCYITQIVTPPHTHTHTQGVQLPIYVIEIRILPFVPNPSAHEDTLQLAPVYQNEEGTSFLRKTASNKSVRAMHTAL